ncbi:MAG TPA: hypothetical protein DCF42_08350, partial [Lachnospiraceae bacterium]|nr:hypothetical protein [Lachnospiraceae bacterium]
LERTPDKREVGGSSPLKPTENNVRCFVLQGQADTWRFRMQGKRSQQRIMIRCCGLFFQYIAGFLPERKEFGQEKTVQYIDKNRFA